MEDATTGSNVTPTSLGQSQGSPSQPSQHGATQTHLQRYVSNLHGGGNPFVYNRETMIDNMATYVTFNSLPLNYCESYHLEKFITLSLQPAYKRVCRNTLKHRIVSQYYLAKSDLIEYFDNFDGRVVLTSDIWISKQGESYLCINAHWVDCNYLLQKRTISFDVMEDSPTGHAINSQIYRALDEFSLREKVFSISFDNVTFNTDCIDHIKKSVSLLLDDVLLHVRCCAHVINSSAQDGISSIAPLLTPIRRVLKWLRITGSIRRKYKTLCKGKGLRPKHFLLDIPTMWISTYKMLVQALAYKDIIIDLYNDFHANSETFVNDHSWQTAQHICTLLGAYYHATNVFSMVNDPNVNLIIMECVNIVKTMCDCEQNEPCLQPIIFEMKTKWLSYFHEFPVICGIACLLDPGIKYDGLTNLLDFYYETLGIEYNVKNYVDYCVSILHKLYDIYAKDSGSSSSPKLKSRRFDDELASVIFGKSTKVSIASSSFVINQYLSFTYETNYSDFKILSWWRNHSAQFPILSRIARDVLAVPVSTTVSQSAFSTCIDFLDEKISRLPPDFVKIYVCKRDWDQAKERQQGGGEEDDDDEMLSSDSDADN